MADLGTAAFPGAVIKVASELLFFAVTLRPDEKFCVGLLLKSR
jgi:hypothetical protein